MNTDRRLPVTRQFCTLLVVDKSKILEALPNFSAEDRREIRAKLNELDGQELLDEGELTEREKAIIEARLAEFERDSEAGSSWEEGRTRIVAKIHEK